MSEKVWELLAKWIIADGFASGLSRFFDHFRLAYFTHHVT